MKNSSRARQSADSEWVQFLMPAKADRFRMPTLKAAR